MKKSLYLFFLYLITNLCFSQNVNFIIQVNDRLLNNGEIANLYLTIGKENNAKKYYVNYYPGDLILNEEFISEFNLNKLSKIYLHFDYYTYKKDKQEIGNFDIELVYDLFQKPYLIANIFDFRNKKYKHWYQWLTKEKYLVQLTYPNSGLYVRRI
jgi:hypothetical protein